MEKLADDYLKVSKKTDNEVKHFVFYAIVALVILYMIYMFINYKKHVRDLSGFWYINGYIHHFDHDKLTGVIHGGVCDEHQLPSNPEKIGKLFSLENGELYQNKILSYDDYKIVTQGFTATRATLQ